MANLLNITIEQGADFQRLLTIRSEDTTPINLTGYIFRGQARESYGKPDQAFAFSFTVLDQVASPGQVQWSLPHAALESLALKAAKEYVYDVEMESSGGIVTRIIQGTATVTPEVTK